MCERRDSGSPTCRWTHGESIYDMISHCPKFLTYFSVGQKIPKDDKLHSKPTSSFFSLSSGSSSTEKFCQEASYHIISCFNTSLTSPWLSVFLLLLLLPPPLRDFSIQHPMKSEEPLSGWGSLTSTGEDGVTGRRRGGESGSGYEKCCHDQSNIWNHPQKNSASVFQWCARLRL